MAVLNQPEHETWMRLAYREAARAFDVGEVPIGAVLVCDGRVVGTGYNQPIGAVDPTAHAEVVALRAGAANIGNYRLTGATLYVTVEPCLMCAGALVHARVGTLVFGAPEPRTGAVRSVMRALDHPAHNHRVEVVEGVLGQESRELMLRFFRSAAKNRMPRYPKELDAGVYPATNDQRRTTDD